MLTCCLVKVIAVDDELRWERFCAIADDSMGNRIIGRKKEPIMDVFIKRVQYQEPELPRPARVDDNVVMRVSTARCHLRV
jgi:hypothetical protein